MPLFGQHKPPQGPVRQPVIPPPKPSDASRSVRPVAKSLSYTNEGWRLVERYIRDYSKNDCRLVFKRREEVLEIFVDLATFHAFDRRSEG